MLQAEMSFLAGRGTWGFRGGSPSGCPSDTAASKPTTGLFSVHTLALASLSATSLLLVRREIAF